MLDDVTFRNYRFADDGRTDLDDPNRWPLTVRVLQSMDHSDTCTFFSFSYFVCVFDYCARACTLHHVLFGVAFAFAFALAFRVTKFTLAKQQ